MVQAVKALTEGVPHGTANLANAAAILFEGMEGLNWAGFYLLEGDRLVLGPFQGKTACIVIPLGKGVCGTAAAENRTLRVPDVHLFPGHIACDSASASEIVIPLRKGGRVVGVLDLDSPEKDRFSAEDQAWLEAFAGALCEAELPGMPAPAPAFELRAARQLAAEAVRGVVREGDAVVDATAGNGHDTCFLAGLVGETGKVYAFDIQEAALRSTAARLEAEHLAERVTLFHAGHEHLAEKVPGPVRAVMFNLGWFPGGDKSVTTHWETTVSALEQALERLLPLGLCTVCAYPGHAAGEEERRNLAAWLAKLPPQEYNVLRSAFLNAGPGAPECFIIQRMKKETKNDAV